jgi:transcriptional regulator with XRE-family HTH domain
VASGSLLLFFWYLIMSNAGNYHWLCPLVITNGNVYSLCCQEKIQETTLRPRTKNNQVGELSQAVKKLREALGQTQQDFAQTLDAAITTIARYETGRAPKGGYLARLAEIASQNNLIELSEVFRGALIEELGSWDSTGYTLDLEPKDDRERLYVAAVMTVLRNPQFTKVISELNKALKPVAAMNIEKLAWTKNNRTAQRTAREMSQAGKTPDEIALKVGVPVEEVREFLSWVRFEEITKANNRVAVSPQP